MGLASGCGEQEVGVAGGSGWNLWVWLLGVVVRRCIDFFYYLSLLPLYFFTAASLLIVHLKNVFHSCSLFCNYILCINSFTGVRNHWRKSTGHAFLASFNRNTARKRYPYCQGYNGFWSVVYTSCRICVNLS